MTKNETINNAIVAAKKMVSYINASSQMPITELLDNLQYVDVQVFDKIPGETRAQAGFHNEYLRTLRNIAEEIERDAQDEMLEYSRPRKLQELEAVKAKISDGAAKLAKLGKITEAEFYQTHAIALVNLVIADTEQR